MNSFPLTLTHSIHQYSTERYQKVAVEKLSNLIVNILTVIHDLVILIMYIMKLTATICIESKTNAVIEP